MHKSKPKKQNDHNLNRRFALRDLQLPPPQPTNCQRRRSTRASDNQINVKDIERFQQFGFVNYFKTITQAFKKYYGRHYPVHYRENYGFKQQWERTKKIQKIKENTGSAQNMLFLIAITIILTISLWSLSLSLVFEWKSTQWIYCLIISSNLMALWKKFKKWGIPIDHKQKLKKYGDDLCCLIFCVFCLSKGPTELREMQIIWGILVFILLYIKCSKHYKDLKIFHISSYYQDFVNLFDLFSMLITITHIFALALFSITLAHPQGNWMDRLNLDQPTWQTQYIYSVYFSSTTLLTVGYGDISPTNPHQILVILVTQLIGIATFAYTVNQIGAALTSMQEKKEKMQKDLNNIEAIGNTYRLDSNILCRMRTELMNNKVLSDDMRVEEETQLLLKFSDDLRDQIQMESCIKVIKRSADILVNWSGRFQAKIANKLVKNIYTTQEPLLQTIGKEQLYIIDQGKVEIVNNFRIGHKVFFQKVLKVIEMDKKKQIATNNVFGYSHILCEKPLRINAICKSTAIVYSLSKCDFMECLHECEQDLQHFYRLKSEIELLQIPEELEAPAIKNIRQHYNPLPTHIINRYKLRNKNNERSEHMRGGKKISTQIYEMTQQFLYQIQGSIKKGLLGSNKMNTSQSLSIESSCSKSESESEIEEVNNPDQALLTDFEIKKDYQRYFKNRNCETQVYKMKSRNISLKTNW